MKKLIIVESPAKIKTISKFLDKDYKIISTMGHIKDLPSKEIGIVVTPDEIQITYVPLEGKEKTISELIKQARSSDEIFLAPDPDREGEIIAWHAFKEIEKVIKKSTQVFRIAFNEITKQAVIEAIAHPSTIDLAKVEAQQARRILDRWVGYEVSPILWQKVSPGLSAGRVQSVALRMICDRENAIRTFKPEEYWSIELIFKQNIHEFTTTLDTIDKEPATIKTEKEALSVLEIIKESKWTVKSITDKERSKNATAPFMTSSLQQAAYNRLGFSVKKTMQIAQKLYEGIPLQDPSSPIALITYMRTDSIRLSDTALLQARTFIEKHFSKEYLPLKPISYQKKSASKAQDAHEAIRPIDILVTPEIAQRYLPSDEAKLYTLIWQRFVACQMNPALYSQRTIIVEGAGSKKILTAKATGSTLLFDGFLKVYHTDEDDSDNKTSILPPIDQKKPIQNRNNTPKQHFTQPPARFSEATLVKEMEKEGIGRPSTYATILNTIRARSYTTLEKKRFVPTELGMTVTTLLAQNLPDIMDLKFTARMEEDLDKIAQGKIERDKLLRSFYKSFHKNLQAFIKNVGGKEGKVTQPTDITCPQCKKHTLSILFGKGGEFLGCSNYPTCSFTSNFKRDEQGNIELITPEPIQLLEEKCPQCDKQLRIIKGRFGEFTACSGYPQCKYIKPIKAFFNCPICSKDIVQKQWRGGKFWGCSGYPQCKFAIFDQVIQESCKECLWPFMTQKNGKGFCANKECLSKK